MLQSIINAAVDMSTAVTTTTTPSAIVNANIPPRPERVSPPGPPNYPPNTTRQHSRINSHNAPVTVCTLYTYLIQ